MGKLSMRRENGSLEPADGMIGDYLAGRLFLRSGYNVFMCFVK